LIPEGPCLRETWAEAGNSSVNSVLALISNPRPSGGGFLIPKVSVVSGGLTPVTTILYKGGCRLLHFFRIHHGIGDPPPVQNLHYRIGDVGDKLALSWTHSGLFLEEANGYIDPYSIY